MSGAAAHCGGKEKAASRIRGLSALRLDGVTFISWPEKIRYKSMRSNRLLLSLITLTVLMQAAILYDQHESRVRDHQRIDPVQDASQDADIDIRGLPGKGDPSARIVLAEFSDYECPFCQRHADSVGPQIDQAFISRGLVRLVFINNPLPIHKNAKMLATSAICAGVENRYWDMHDSLFRLKPTDKTAIMRIAEMLMLNQPRFRDCLESNVEAEATIQRDVRIAKHFDLSVTPAFGVGSTDGSDHVQIRKFIKGAVPFEVFEKTITEMLSKQAKS